MLVLSPGKRMGKRILIVGGGAVAEARHIPAALGLVGIERVVVAEPVAIRRDELARAWSGLRLVADYREVLAGADVAVLTTPPQLHASIACECLEAGLDVLCEKPLANTVAECARMQVAAERSGRTLAVVHNYRFFPNRARLREEILAGGFGGEVQIDVVEGAPAAWRSQSGYTFRKELVPGGVLLNNGIHSLDFILWCLGEPRDILDYRDDSLGGLESNAVLRLWCQRGLGSLRISRTAELSNCITVAGRGRKATMKVYEMNGWQEAGRYSEQKSETIGGEIVTNWHQLSIAQLRDFLDAVRTTRPACADGRTGSAVVDVIERAYASKRSRLPPQRAPVPGAMW
jgi:predicted dehydrogenase